MISYVVAQVFSLIVLPQPCHARDVTYLFSSVFLGVLSVVSLVLRSLLYVEPAVAYIAQHAVGVVECGAQVDAPYGVAGERL